jgi:hypothetical protein
MAPKGGCFRSGTGNRDLKMLFYEIELVYFFFARNFNKEWEVADVCRLHRFK